MADLRPFRALRPRADLAERVAAPPYDVVDTTEARRLAAGNPDSILRVTRPEIAFGDDTPVDSPQVHAAGRAALDDLVGRGRLVADAAPTYSVLRQQRGDHVQTGVVAVAGVRDYVEGRIRTHEQTRHDKELDRTAHIRALGGNDEPVLLLAAPGEPAWDGVRDLLDGVCAGDALAEVRTADGVVHTLWRVDDLGTVAALEAALAALPELFVADGHHRSAAAARASAVEPEADAFLAVVFDGAELQILPYNRVVADLAGLSEEGFIARLGELGEVAEPAGSGASPGRLAPGQVAVRLPGRWLVLRYAAAPPVDPVAGLDVALLQDRVLAPILGIEDPRSDERIGFVGGVHGAAALAEAVDSGRAAVAFLLPATGVAELVAVASPGRDMPPKSTWFEPKLLSGLLLHPWPQRA